MVTKLMRRLACWRRGPSSVLEQLRDMQAVPVSFIGL